MTTDPKSRSDIFVYVVKPNDSLFNIARYFGVSWHDIWRATELYAGTLTNRNPSILYTGEQLYIPAIGAMVPTYRSVEWCQEMFARTGEQEYFDEMLDAIEKDWDEKNG